MAGRVPLTTAKDSYIEKWLRSTPMAKEERQGRLHLPKLGKPTAIRRGKVALSSAQQSPYRRRVIVIAYHYRMAGQGYAKLHEHINYVERPGAGEASVTPTLFGADSDKVPGHSAIVDWRNDRHHWRFILAPADGGRLDMVAYTREFMAEVERTTGTKLHWMAGVHEKADATHERNRHAHIIVRGIADDGSDLVLDREYIRHEMRRIAEDLATRHLGQMSQRERDRFVERQAERERAGERNYHAGYRPRREEDRDRD